MDLVIDNFAGGGGASTGIEAALGRPIDIAINHDPQAIAMHRINHPRTQHLITNVMDVDPRRLARGRRIGLAWFSPDCTYHSKARGGKPFRDRDTARRRRGLAWSVTTWAKQAGPSLIMLENVEEFAYWGPLREDGTICPQRRGSTFRRWVRMLENLGYAVDMRELPASEYGAPTFRKRLFVIARRDGQEIVFPEATHGPGLQPYRTAAECIDWSIPCPSIFERKRDLVDATKRRIARGVMRFVVNNPAPFIIGIDNRSNGSRDAWDSSNPLRTITTENRFALVAAFMAQHNTGMTGHMANKPLSTIVSSGAQQQLVTSHLLHLRNNCDARSVTEPLRTISAGGTHFGEVRAFLMSYYGTEQAPSLSRPAPTIRTRDHIGIVTVHGEPYRIADIGMRMLTPRELYRAQSFPENYIIDHGIDAAGELVTMNKTDQIRMCGNSVCPAVAEALVRANVTDQQQQQQAA